MWKTMVSAALALVWTGAAAAQAVPPEPGAPQAPPADTAVRSEPVQEPAEPERKPAEGREAAPGEEGGKTTDETRPDAPRPAPPPNR
ncbi:MAG: hypothetical protein ACK4MT_00950 [Thermaurantiacus tibetensis]|uniref:hypothetical protein n=1 Tax=Thermaurantiacus tibetensis TaxID=2759035 RepID=UPI00188F0611|nr:hypothetical protein [Thermaurantiacus tibetensis]